MKVIAIKKGNETILKDVKVATTFFERFCGLMGKKNITSKDIMVFPSCNSIHTIFMRESIDVVFVSNQGVVVKIFGSLKPWKMLMPQRGAAHCIEMPSEETHRLGIKEGDLIICEGIFG